MGLTTFGGSLLLGGRSLLSRSKNYNNNYYKVVGATQSSFSEISVGNPEK